ncbi:MAG: hypothetical protein KGS72_18305 [Cyanobacteria bacterium REEB67]|nr:hypothetical protein [Cyanobacteria bacterium REEB67]
MAFLLRTFPTDDGLLVCHDSDTATRNALTRFLPMKDESLFDKVVANANPVDFAVGLYDGAIARPANAVRQIVAESSIASTSKAKPDESFAHKAGALTGQIVDFSLIAMASRAVLKPMLGAAVDSISGVSGSMFVAGAFDGGLLTSSDPSRGLLAGRGENALVNGATFAFMGGAGKALEAVSLVKAAPLLDQSLKSATTGAGGGVVFAYAHAGLHGHRLAKADEVLSSACQYAAFSLGLSALHAGAVKTMEIPQVRSAYLRGQWKMQDAAVESKRLTYATLNHFNMRHPIQRLTDAVLGEGRGNPMPRTRPALTAENNPVRAFHQDYAQYIKDIDAAELKYDTAPRQERRDHYDKINEIKGDFAAKLLGHWYGTAERPGLASFSDVELASTEYPVEKVAQVRQALTASMKRPAYNTASPFEAAMERLSPGELEGSNDTYEIGSGLGSGKEKFFDFSEKALSEKLGLNSEHHFLDRNHSTPLSWMPFEPSQKLANLFHCTVSRSLDSVLTERALLSSREMRLRGISQETGESAGNEFPSRAISMTRNFPVAFCYHRHSPAALTDFPLVFGISRDVVSRSQLAGFLEPGELLVDKLKIGTSWLDRLTGRKPDVTHIYAPDSEVDNINHMLSRRRISGVNVVGFNEIDEPQWNQTPARMVVPTDW